MIGSQKRQIERVGALRGRLIASILIASLVPFFAAWWIANAYVADQARTNADMRLSFSARSAAREASALLTATRSRALELAEYQRLQRAARRRDRPALERLLGAGEAVNLPARGPGARRFPPSGSVSGSRGAGRPCRGDVGRTAPGDGVRLPARRAVLLDRVAGRRSPSPATTSHSPEAVSSWRVRRALRGAPLGQDGKLRSGNDLPRPVGRASRV